MKCFHSLAVLFMVAAMSAATVSAQEIPSQFDVANHLNALRESGPAPVSIAGDPPAAPSEFGLAAASPVTQEMSAEPDSSMKPDSSVKPSYRRLLPPNMSIMEKALWGENGFMRQTGIVGPLAPQERKSELNLRRTMLTTHQIGGFVTLAFMWSAVYFGQQIIDGHPEYRRNHQYAVTGTIITYTATGLLAILSPPPLIRRDEVSTTTIHKTLAWVHVAGMILTPILGGMIKHRHSTNTQVEHFHQFSGYATTAVFTASMITVTF